MTGAALNFAAGLAGILIAYMVGSRAERLGRMLGLLDFPDPFGGRKRHEHVTPLVGGLAIVAAFEVTAIAVILLFDADSVLLDWQLAWVAAAAGAMAMVGLVDDRFGLSPVFRLGITTVVLGLTITYAPDFRVEFLRFEDVDNLIILTDRTSIVFTLVCLIGLLNAVNMADGKNGLVVTLAIIWTGILFARNPASFDALLCAVMGCLIVLLVFNMQGVLFLGDSGSYGISAIFGLLGVYAYNHSFATFSADQVATMFLVPVLDTVRLMAWRLVQGRSPFAGDRNHLHHYLHARWGWPAGLVIYAALVATPNVFALLIPTYSLAWLGLGIALYSLTLWVTTRRRSFHEGYST